MDSRKGQTGARCPLAPVNSCFRREAFPKAFQLSRRCPESASPHARGPLAFVHHISINIQTTVTKNLVCKRVNCLFGEEPAPQYDDDDDIQPIAYGMAFPPQQPALQTLEDVNQLHQDAGPDMLWTPDQDFESDLTFNQSFNSTHQTNRFGFQNDHVASSISPYSFSPSVHMPVSQTGPPFKPRQLQVSDFRQYNTDAQFSGRKSAGSIELAFPSKQAEGPLYGAQLGFNQHRVGLPE